MSLLSLFDTKFRILPAIIHGELCYVIERKRGLSLGLVRLADKNLIGFMFYRGTIATFDSVKAAKQFMDKQFGSTCQSTNTVIGSKIKLDSHELYQRWEDL